MATGETAEAEQDGQSKSKIIESGYQKARAHVIISGIVQGIFFRSTLRNQAKLFGVNGWTRNTPEGNVEAVFEGDKDQIEKVITFCWKGPPGAFVRNVNVEWHKPKYDLHGFEIRY